MEQDNSPWRLLQRLAAALHDTDRELHSRELHHFEAEKALTDVLALSHAISRDSHCSHLGADIRALIPSDIPIQQNRSE